MLSIPDSVWAALLDAFAQTDPGLERVAYLDGYRCTDGGKVHGVVTTVTIPDANLNPRNYQVIGDAVSQAAQHLFAHGMVRLAQVHTHGGANTAHSRINDERAYSQLDGAISIVLPKHARDRPDPLDGTVHVRGPHGWGALANATAADHIRVVPSIVDLQTGFISKARADRDSQWTPNESAAATKATSAEVSARTQRTLRSRFTSRFRR